jgi:ribosome-associated toxin RatA of RatAB toxin-antitoxin module
MKRIVRTAIVGHPAERMFSLVEDIESYPRFLPWCLGAVVHERTGTRTVATLSAGVGAIRQSFTTENVSRPGQGIDMRLLKGPFRSFTAAWRFEPLAENASKIEFTLQYEFSGRILAKALGPLFNQIADTMVDSFTRRAAELGGQDRD